jgi:hypothetical protein
VDQNDRLAGAFIDIGDLDIAVSETWHAAF